MESQTLKLQLYAMQQQTSLFSNIAQLSKVQNVSDGTFNKENIAQRGGIQIESHIIIDSESTIFKIEAKSLLDSATHLCIIDSMLAKISDDSITETLNLEYWILQESNTSFGHIIHLSNPTDKLILKLPDLQTWQNWLKILKTFTIKLNIKADYSFLRQLGTGASAKVFLAQERGKISGLQYAVKSIKKSYLQESAFRFEGALRELKILRIMKESDKVIQIYAIYEDSEFIHLVLEYVKGGTLNSFCTKHQTLQEGMLKKVFSQLLQGLSDIHARGIVHRDLKMDNILIGNFDDDNIEIKIADLGLAEQIVLPETMLYQRCGSPGYIAPEVLRNQGYDQKADIFSMGAVFYSILTNKGLIEGYYKSLKEYLLANRYCNLRHVSERMQSAPLGAREITIKMLTINKRLRPSADDLLQFPWVAQWNYSSHKVDEQINESLIEIPALMQASVDIDDPMASVIIGNFQFHDSKSISSNGSSYQFLRSFGPNSLLIDSRIVVMNNSIGSNKNRPSKLQQSPLDKLRLRPFAFGKTGEISKAVNLIPKLVGINPLRKSRNEPDLVGHNNQITGDTNQNVHYNKAYSQKYHIQPKINIVLEHDEKSKESDVETNDVTERKLQIITEYYKQARVDKVSMESRHMRTIIENPKIKVKRIFIL